MSVPLDQVPYNYGEYFDMLKTKLGIGIYGDQTMMLLYKIDLSKVHSVVTLIPLTQMAELFSTTDKIVVY